MTDNVTNLFGSTNDNTDTPKVPKELPLWEVDLQDGSVVTVFGEFRISPISAAFYDFKDQVDTLIMLDQIVSVQRIGSVLEDGTEVRSGD